MCGWCELTLATPGTPGGQVAERFGDIAPHDAAFRWLFACLLAGLVEGLIVALVALPAPGAPAAARRVVLTLAAGTGALATVLAAVLGRPWPVIAALALLAGVARDRPSRRLLAFVAVVVAVLVAVLAALEPAVVFAPVGGIAAYAVAQLTVRDSSGVPASLVIRGPADSANRPPPVTGWGEVTARVRQFRPAVHNGVVAGSLREHAGPLIAVGLVVGAAGWLGAPPVAAPAPVLRAGVVGDLTVSVWQAGGTVTVRTASGRRPPPAPIDRVDLDLGGRAVPLFRGASGLFAGTLDAPAAGSAVTAIVTVRRAGERFTVPLAWTAPRPAPPPSRLPRAELLTLAVLALAVVHRKIGKDAP
ncbi:hypothetical protein ACQP2F_06080 [Actinoplanes sp. CA-030573]|uniref:hypothetical protein n=1 Tax=Actinoplanes sp. CA-030573 TaxID=3239898 RepID=UPI003D8BEC8E